MCEFAGLTFDAAEGLNLFLAALLGALLAYCFARAASKELWIIARALSYAAEHPGKVKFERDERGHITGAVLVETSASDELAFTATGTLHDATASGKSDVAPGHGA